MSESVHSTGLALLRRSPFQSSLPAELDSTSERFDPKEALGLAESSDIFSDVGQYLKRKDALKEHYEHGVLSNLLKNGNALSTTLQAELSGGGNDDPASKYLKFKLLSEFALSQLNHSDKLLSLDELHHVKDKLRSLERHRDETKLQLTNNNKLVQNILSLEGDLPLDELDTLRTLISTNNVLSQDLIQISSEIETTTKFIDNQHLLTFYFSHFEELDLQPSDPHHTSSTKGVPNKSVDRDYEELISHIAASAVQNNIPLPSPKQGVASSEWAKECISSLASNTTNSSSKALSEGSEDKEALNGLQTAFNDLQFAHKYLTRQYEEERTLHSSVLEAHEKKKRLIEKQLSENLILLEKANQRSILIEHEKNVLETKLDKKIEENMDLQRSIANLKIENLGYVQVDPNVNISRGKENRLSPTSPLTGFHLTMDQDETNLKYLSPSSASNPNPKTPLLQQDINVHRTLPGTQTSPKFNSSISVLRNEFKKLVNDMQTNFQDELRKEKTERKRLQNLVKLLEERDTELNAN